MPGSQRAIPMQAVGAGTPRTEATTEGRATVLWAERAIHAFRGQNGVMVQQHSHLLYPDFGGGSPTAVAHSFGPNENYKYKMCWCLLLSWVIKHCISFLRLLYQITIDWVLKNNRSLFSDSSETRSLKSKCQQGWVLPSRPFQLLWAPGGPWACGFITPASASIFILPSPPVSSPFLF